MILKGIKIWELQKFATPVFWDCGVLNSGFWGHNSKPCIPVLDYADFKDTYSIILDNFQVKPDYMHGKVLLCVSMIFASANYLFPASSIILNWLPCENKINPIMHLQDEYT